MANIDLNCFKIHGVQHGVYHDGGIVFSQDPDEVRLGDFQFRINERFLYEYDFTDQWLHQIRIENILEDHTKKHKKLIQKIEEFESYIRNNAPFIPNYGERYRYGETITTAFTESTINQVVSKRMVNKQQMRWSQEGAHLLLQVRTRVLNGDLRDALGNGTQGLIETVMS